MCTNELRTIVLNKKHLKEIMNLTPIRKAFGSDGPTLFYHSNSKAPLNSKDEGDYLQRPAIMAAQGDAIVSNGFDEGYLDYLRDLGFPEFEKVILSYHPNLTQEILGGNVEVPNKGRFADYNMAFYLDNEHHETIRKTLGVNRDYSRNSNNEIVYFADKGNFRKICQEHQIPVVEGGIFYFTGDKVKDKKNLETVILDNLGVDDEAVLRATGDIPGSKLNRIIGKENLDSKLEDLFNSEEPKINLETNTGILIDRKLDLIDSPNVTYHITKDGSILLIGASSQVMEGLKHRGNDFDFKNLNKYQTIHEHGLKIVNSLSQLGYRGSVGVDFLEEKQGNIFGCEINLRSNGNSYAVAAIQQLSDIGIPSYYAKSLHLKLDKPYQSFNQFREENEELLLTKSNPSGIFPLSRTALSNGGLSSLFIGNDKNQLERNISLIEEKFSLKS